MYRFQREVDRLLGSGAAPSTSMQTYPPISVWLSDDSVVVTAELPGFSTDDVELTVQDDTLTLRGERNAPDAEGTAWHRRERPAGRFSRRVDLPFRVDGEGVDARFRDGVLAVEMKRPEADRPRRIEISAG
jgi:HSP20 family protein